MELDEKGDGINKHKLIVIGESWGCEVWFGEGGQWCVDYVWYQVTGRVLHNHFLNYVGFLPSGVH